MIYACCGMAINSAIPLPQLRRSRGPAVCSIALDRSTAPLGPIEWFREWRNGRARRWLSFGRSADHEYVLRFADRLADFLVTPDGTQVRVRASDGLPADTLHHLLVDQVLPLVASRHGRLALHASAVHIDGVGTVGFAGEAGRGKSTLAAAFAAAGSRVVTDDCLVLEGGGRGIYALPGYPGLPLQSRRAAAHFRPARTVLRALFLLSPRADRGPIAAVRRCGPRGRVLGLLRYAYILDVKDRGDLGGVFSGLADVAATTPVLRLRLRDGARHLREATALIQEFAARA